jgi:hypothetical protein
MQKIIYESIIVGIITSILGSIVIKGLAKVNSLEKNDYIHNFVGKYKKTYMLEISLFFTGILIHLLLEYIGLNKWYCEKKCVGEGEKQICEIVCKRGKIII